MATDTVNQANVETVETERERNYSDTVKLGAFTVKVHNDVNGISVATFADRAARAVREIAEEMANSAECAVHIREGKGTFGFTFETVEANVARMNGPRLSRDLAAALREANFEAVAKQAAEKGLTLSDLLAKLTEIAVGPAV